VPEFLQLPREDQREALLVAAERSGRPLHLLEKDVWVVWALHHLFTGPHAPDLIERADSPWPTSRGQQKKWSKAIRQRLAELVSGKLAPDLTKSLAEQGLQALTRAEGEQLLIDCEACGEGTGYVRPSVLLEFGARSTGEPNELRPVACDAAPHLPDVNFPSATPQVMRPERTFWEKATAIHVFCAQGSFRGGDRYARQWHDVTRLDAAGFADSAAKDRALAHAVAEHNGESSSPNRCRTVRLSTTKQQSPAHWIWHPAATRGRRWPRTTSVWSRPACSWTTPNPSTSCCSVARRLRSRSTRRCWGPHDAVARASNGACRRPLVG
jgi:Nucleotidyl transferase AbiEii toxin, Type IV TA system